MIPQETCWKKGHRRRVAKVRQTDTGGGSDGYCSVPKSHTHSLLKRNKYVGILSIVVTTLQYITISMITIFSMYIVHLC